MDAALDKKEEVWVDMEPLELCVQTDMVAGSNGSYSIIETSGEVEVNRNINDMRAQQHKVFDAREAELAKEKKERGQISA